MSRSPSNRSPSHFEYARRSDVQAPLETLAALEHVEGTGDGAYAA